MRANFNVSFWLVIMLFTPVFFASAGEYTVRPFLLDKVVSPRDIVTDTVLLTNDHATRKYVVYATVNEISIDTEGEIKEFVSPVMTDRTNTVTSWIEVTRGRIEIDPKSQKEVPLTLHINPFAKPGEYHVFVGFVPGPNRPEAEAIAMRGEADGVIVKITVADSREDSMKISSFLIDRFITGEDKRNVDVVIENLGDIASTPTGEVVFYNSRGVEVSSMKLNTDGVIVSPGEKVTLTGRVPVEDTLGRFKANVSLQYGEKQRASLHDTTSFYIMPYRLLLLVFGGILLVSIFVILLFRRVLVSGKEDNEDGDSVMMYVKEGHDANPQDHDIDLKKRNE